ncbi:choice-of-anchor I family protein [Sporosarcina sp. ACRSM]|uniref:choice-of-anchor I family protein n=1 Tax=Sporosarcina sp. ACRSM TaxID=2918216 RepID=UPI001EF6521F|nr:choice-of-anchor I family protein [Sporosarcina sp. ACRSM]MCG7335277.1 choice-of-anchor I family protein [Sporosarcina sp. ACRSM]
MKIKKKVIAGIAAAGILFGAGQPYNVFAEQPPFFQYEGADLKITQIGQYDSMAGLGGTEIMAYDEALKRAFVTNGAVSGIDILSFESLQSGEFTKVRSEKRVFFSEFGIENVSDITSIASHPTKDLVAVSVVSNPKTDTGYIFFLSKEGAYITHVQVGSLPDMVTFTPDGAKAVVANEGEPSDDYAVDPEGTISIIGVTKEPADFTVNTLTFQDVELDDKVRVNSKGTVLQQLEPEYVAVSADSKLAYVAMQENNAIATVDLVAEKILHVKGLGVKDHSLPGNELDGKRNDETKLERLPVLGFYMPDAIDTFTAGGKTYILTPNEGDARDYEAYSEEAEIGDIADKIQLKADHYGGFTQEELDQLVADGLFDEMTKTKITLEQGMSPDGSYEALYSYGGRSFSIFDADTMELVFDSGSEFENITAEALPEFFNTDNEEIAYDKRSSAKGPEPETVVVGGIDGKNYAFIALERVSGIMVYELTNPSHPEFVTYIASRDYSEDIKGDVSPEGLRFIAANQSPTGHALVAATHEVSGTVAIYEFGGKEMNEPSRFEDVNENHWASPYIHDLYNRGVIKGKTETTFAPQDEVTRVQFVTMLANALKLQPTSTDRQFDDVPSAAQDAVQAVFEAEIATGVSEKAFDPNAKLTREQMAIMAVNAYEYATKKAVKVEVKQRYSDLQSVSDDALEDVQRAYALGIMQGDNGTFQPLASSTRAQSAKVMSVLLQQIENELQE